MMTTKWIANHLKKQQTNKQKKEDFLGNSLFVYLGFIIPSNSFFMIEGNGKDVSISADNIQKTVE